MKYLTSYFLFLLSFYPACVISQAAVIRSESFDGTFYPPLGWSAGKLIGFDLNNYTQRVTVGSAPVCSPHSGTGMVRYRSGSMFNSGEQSFLASPRFDLTNNTGTAEVSFWMYKDTWNSIRDSVTLYVNDSAAANSSKGSMSKVIGPVARDTTGFNGWRKYSAIIPAGYQTSSVYMVFVFTNRETSGIGANIYIDDFSVQTFPKPSVLLSSELFYQETLPVGKGQSDQVIIGLKVTVDGAGDSLRVDSIVTNGTGSSNVSMDIVAVSAKLWYTKGTPYFTTNASNQFGIGQTPTYFRDKFTNANFFLENGDNYFWLSYSITPGAVNGNLVDAEFNGIYYRKVSYGGPDISLPPLVISLPGGRPIGALLCNGVLPSYVNGTSANNYTSNDYINRVYLKGANAFSSSYPYIDNNINDQGPPVAPWNSGPAPFTAHPPDYQLFPSSPSLLHPNISAVLTQGVVYTMPSLVAGNPIGSGLALQCGSYSSSNYLAAWVDFNRDGDLLDPGEKIHQSGPMNALTWTFAPVLVPAAMGSSTANAGTAAPFSGIVFGNTVMRIREVFANSSIDPCVTGYNYGETEDYIVSLIPACTSGVKYWLGFTDDWNYPPNWCNGMPGPGDVAVIDKNLAGTSAYINPVIHAGTAASVKTLRLGDLDSLLVDAPSGASLTIADSLAVAYNQPAGSATGLFKINSLKADTIQLSNGNLGFNITPFMSVRKNQRMQLIYTPADLITKGVQAGDQIDSLFFRIRSRATTPAFAGVYNKFFITWARVTPGFSQWPSIPASLASAGPYTVLRDSSLALDMNSSVSLGGLGGGTNVGILKVHLPNPLVWNGTDTIVLNISYNNSLVSLTGVTTNDLVFQTQTTGNNRTMWINNSTTNSGGTRNWPLAAGDAAFTSQYRPNVTFHYVRNYSKFPIAITGNGSATAGIWVNNGNFNPGYSNVTFSNSNQNQYIAGAKVTTFNEVTINKQATAGNEILLLETDAKIDSSLVIQKGKLRLNHHNLVLNSSKPSAIIRNAGGIISENSQASYGFIKWKINNNTADHIFPFITAASEYIPFTYKVNSGNVGTVSIATYHANASVQPYPAGVNHVNDSLGNNNSAYTVKRFWIINKSGAGGIANLKFSYKNNEATAPIVKNNLKPNRYDYGTDLWERFSLPVTCQVGGSISTVKIQNVAGGSLANAAWALSDAGSPLREMPEGQPFAAVFPNPFVESFTVGWEDHEDFTVELYDTSGRLQWTRKVRNGEEISGTGDLAPGIYFVRFQDDRNVKTFRMVKPE